MDKRLGFSPTSTNRNMLRILFILATTTALHVGYTPPNPSPPDNERPTIISTRLSDQFLSLAQSQLPVLKVRYLIIVIVRMKI